MQSASTVHTVGGEVPPQALGRVLAHEHLLSLLPGPGVAAPPGDFAAAAAFADAAVDAAVTALSGLREIGFGAVVDLSPYGDVGRDEHGANCGLLALIAARAGLHVVAGTATYRAEFSPDWVRRASVQTLVDRFVADATAGIGRSGVRAGILGEFPTSEGRVTEHEQRGLRAAARAHHLTGLSISTHTTHGTMALEQIDLLHEEAVPPDRIVIGHMDNHDELDYLRQVLDRGVTIAFDSIGKQHSDVRRPPPPGGRRDGRYRKDAVSKSDQTRARWLAALVAEGWAGQIVLSHDLTGGQVWLNPETHGQYGYRYLWQAFVPLLREGGVTADAIDTMLVTNPARLLAVAS